MYRGIISLLFAGLTLGCHGDTLAPPAEHLSLSAAAGNRCHGVRFQSALLADGTGITGTVSGDLIGETTTVFPSFPVVHGVASLNDGIDFISVTSSTVAGLAGVTIELQHRNIGVSAPGLGSLQRVTGTGEIVAPANVSGHLSFEGAVDFSTFPIPVNFSYRGNICVG